MLRGHRELLLNWFRAKDQLSSGVVEGFNGKAKLTSRKAFGFRICQGAESHCITLLALCPSRNSPTNFADEASSKARRLLLQFPVKRLIALTNISPGWTVVHDVLGFIHVCLAKIY
jgi:hypothetical protein